MSADSDEVPVPVGEWDMEEVIFQNEVFSFRSLEYHVVCECLGLVGYSTSSLPFKDKC